MSWHFLPELEAEYSVESCQGSEPCAPLKSTPSVGRCCSDASWMDAYLNSLYGTTSRRSMENPGGGKSTSLPQDSPASHSRSQENRRARQTKEICGRTPFALLEKFDQNTVYWKTFQGSLLPKTRLYTRPLYHWNQNLNQMEKFKLNYHQTGCKRAPACPANCALCEEATTKPRLRPAVEAAIKKVREKS